MKDIEKIDAALDLIKKSEASDNIKKTAEVIRNGIFDRLEMCKNDITGHMKFNLGGYCSGWNQLLILIFGEGVDGLLKFVIEDAYSMVDDFLRGA